MPNKDIVAALKEHTAELQALMRLRTVQHTEQVQRLDAIIDRLEELSDRMENISDDLHEHLKRPWRSTLSLSSLAPETVVRYGRHLAEGLLDILGKHPLPIRTIHPLLIPRLLYIPRIWRDVSRAYGLVGCGGLLVAALFFAGCRWIGCSRNDWEAHT